MKRKPAAISGLVFLALAAACSRDSTDTAVSGFEKEAESSGEILDIEGIDSVITGIKEAAGDIGDGLDLEEAGRKILNSDEKKAENCVSRYLKSMKKGNLEKAGKCFNVRDYDELNESIVRIYYLDISRGYPLQARIRSFDYEILGAEAEGSNAEVLVKISNADCASIIAAMNISYEEFDGLSDKELNRVYEAFLDETDVLDYAEVFTLEKEGDKWYINGIGDMKEFGRALIGWCDVLTEE